MTAPSMLMLGGMWSSGTTRPPGSTRFESNPSNPQSFLCGMFLKRQLYSRLLDLGSICCQILRQTFKVNILFLFLSIYLHRFGNPVFDPDFRRGQGLATAWAEDDRMQIKDSLNTRPFL